MDNPSTQLELEFPPHPFEIPEKLNTKQKLFALRDDPNAGFLPFSHREKSIAVSMLDYLIPGDRQYPAGIVNQLQEVFIHNRRDFDLETAKRAMVSIPYEYGDFALNAKAQLIALRSLNLVVSRDLINPRLNLSGEFPDGHPGIAPLIRFRDVYGYRERDKDKSVFDMLRTVVIRHEINDDEHSRTAKNKTLHDQYTAPFPTSEVSQRIHESTATLVVGDIRDSLISAADNESARLGFWVARLEDTRKHGAAWPTSKEILAELRGE